MQSRSRSNVKGYRSNQRTQIKARQRALLIKAGIVFAVLLSLYLIIGRLAGGNEGTVDNKIKQSGVESSGGDNGKTKHAKKQADPATKSRKQVIGVFVGGKEGVSPSLYHAIVVVEGGTAKIISLPGDIITSVSKNKYEKLQSAVQIGGRKAVLSSLSELTGLKIKQFLYLSKDFGDLSPGNLSDAFLKAREANLSAEKRFNISQRLAKGSATKIYYPVREVRVGGDSYSQPLDSELRTIKEILGVTEVTNSRAKVLVLNGNGEPGIGGKVALKLLKNGYLIDDIKNLKNPEGKDSFNQAETVAYGNIKYDSEINRLISLLGIGKRTDIRPATGTQITLILGKDYK